MASLHHLFSFVLSLNFQIHIFPITLKLDTINTPSLGHFLLYSVGFGQDGPPVSQVLVKVSSCYVIEGHALGFCEGSIDSSCWDRRYINKIKLNWIESLPTSHPYETAAPDSKHLVLKLMNCFTILLTSASVLDNWAKLIQSQMCQQSSGKRQYHQSTHCRLI